MMMPRGAPEQKHPKGGESSKKVVSPMHLQLFRSEESRRNRFYERLKKPEKEIFTKNPESLYGIRNPEFRNPESGSQASEGPHRSSLGTEGYVEAELEIQTGAGQAGLDSGFRIP